LAVKLPVGLGDGAPTKTFCLRLFRGCQRLEDRGKETDPRTAYGGAGGAFGVTKRVYGGAK